MLIPPEIESLRAVIWSLFGDELKRSKDRTEARLQELRHRADEMRNNPQVDASYRMAAQMVHDAAVLALEGKK